MSFLRFLWPYLAGQQKRYASALLLTMLEGVLFAIPPLAVGLGLMVLINGPVGPWDMAPYAALCLIAVVLRILVNQQAWRLGISAGDHATETLRCRLEEHMRKVPLGVLSGRWSSARLATLIVEDGRWFNETAIFFLIRLAFGLVATLALALVVAWFSPIALVTVLAAIAGSLVVMSVVKPIGERVIQSRNDLITNAMLRVGEFADGIAVFRTFGQSGRANTNLRHAVMQLHQIALSATPVLIPLQQLGAAMASFAAPLVITLIAVFHLSGVVEYAPAYVIPALILTLAAAAAFASSVLKILLPMELGNRARLNISAFLSIPELSGDRSDFEDDLMIAFEDVSFHYASDHKAAMSAVDFTSPPGSMTAIVGASGAGKSTLVSLLLRFHEPSKGKIVIGGLDISQADPAAVQARVSLVNQDVHLFRDTLRANLLMGDPKADDSRLSRVIDAAQLGELIEALPDGLDTVLGDTGRTLSGGERQRVAIARAFLKDAPIVILDEATSAIDPITERAIQDALAALETGRSVIVIAHRLHTVVDADQILVMEHGRVVERGTHDALVAQNSHYQRLWAAQEKAAGWRLR